MRSKVILFAGLLILILGGAILASTEDGAENAQASDGVKTEASSASARPENDNKLIQVQEDGGNPARPGNVKVEFYGHDAFKITSPSGSTVLLDPWRNDPTGVFGTWFTKQFPEIPVDLVVSTHAHFDHDAVDRPKALMVMERPIGDYRLGDVALEGLAEKHQCHSEGKVDWDVIGPQLGITLCPPNNDLAFDNTIQIIKTGGLRIVDWGDNRPVPSPALDRELHNLDVLILPIDGSEHILTFAEANAIIQKYKPKAVIPGHYLDKGLTTAESTLEPADSWVATQLHVKRISTGEIVFNARELRGATGRVYYFGDGYKTE